MRCFTKRLGRLLPYSKMAEVSGLEERALERKAKLQALRAKRDEVSVRCEYSYF